MYLDIVQKSCHLRVRGKYAIYFLALGNVFIASGLTVKSGYTYIVQGEIKFVVIILLP